MPTTAELSDIKRDFDLKGYAHLRHAFTAARVDGLRQDLDRFLADSLSQVSGKSLSTNRDGDLIQVKGLNRYSPVFEALLHDPDLVRLATALLGQPVAPSWVHFRNAPCQTDDEVFPHQDAQGLNLHPCHAVTFWMPLDACGPSSGCLRYVPGSHWQGFQDLPYAPASVERVRHREVTFTVDGGDVLAHHCMTIHRSAPNTTPKRRPALMFFFKAAAAETIDPNAWLARYGAKRMAG